MNLIFVTLYSFVISFLSNFNFQSFGIGYSQIYPDGQVRVHAEQPQPMIRVRPDLRAAFKRYSFVDAVLNLDPVGTLRLLPSDYKVEVFALIEFFFPFLFVE